MEKGIIYGIDGTEMSIEDAKEIKIISLRYNNILYMKEYLLGNGKRLKCLDYSDLAWLDDNTDSCVDLTNIKTALIEKFKKSLKDIDHTIMSIWVYTPNDRLIISKVGTSPDGTPFENSEEIPYSEMFSALRTNANYRELMFTARSISEEIVYKMKPYMTSREIDNEFYQANEYIMNKMMKGN